MIPEEELHNAASQTKRNHKYTIIVITPTVTPQSACIALVVNHSTDIYKSMCYSSWCDGYCWVGHHSC